MRNFSVTEGPTEKVILGDAYIHDACMHDAYTYAPWSLCICAWCINVWCMYTSMILDTWLCCMCVWCGWNFVPDGRTNEPTNEQGDSRSWMQYADTYEACIYDACMCDACQKWGRTDERMDGKLNSRSRMSVYFLARHFDKLDCWKQHRIAFFQWSVILYWNWFSIIWRDKWWRK